MKQEWKEYQINGERIKAYVSVIEKGDKELLRKLCTDWRDLSKGIKDISTRGLNIPEAITENAFCLFFEDCVRISVLLTLRDF